MQPRPSRWMQYHQLVEPLLAAVQVSVLLYGPFTVSWRFVGAEGPPEGGGGGGGGGGAGFRAAAPPMRTSASTKTAEARTIRRTGIFPYQAWWHSPGVSLVRLLRAAAPDGLP